MTEEKQVIVPAQVLQDIVNYLARHPYEQVYKLIAALMKCQPQEPKDDNQISSS